MRCLKAATLSLVLTVATLYAVVILFVGDRASTSVFRYVPSLILNAPTPKWVSVASVEDADVQVEGSNVEITFNSSFPRSENEKINIFIVLHSHVDPGWLETFDVYYTKKVESILNLAVAQLTEKPDLRFIWSEVSFLERWWREANTTQRARAKKLIAEGRLEVCGGSWVMTDEATPYFWASIDNLIEGQRFLTETFNVTPTTSWSVDPFGHGTMIPYLLPLAGIENMVIGRINNELKQKIRQKTLLTLNWKQPWKNQNSRNSPKPAFVNVLPNLYYTTSDACGPDSEVCCQFDLGPSARSLCDSRADNISVVNVAAYADLLADQYRKLSRYYRSPSVLVPVGDDFFFSTKEDWTTTYDNYRQLVDFINSNPKYNMKIRFATAAEFFASISIEEKTAAPSLVGDFFPYLDNRLGSFSAWTGFYAQLPYHKRMGRIVEEKLRSLDLLRLSSASTDRGLQDALVESRRNLALFQHHDGITGTSKKHVMGDFLQRLYSAFENITDAQARLFDDDSAEKFTAVDFVDYGKTLLTMQKLFSRSQSELSQIAIFNPLTIRSTRRVVVRVDSPKVRVSARSRPVEAQILPLMVNGALSSELFELLFFVHLDPLATTEVSLEFVDAQPSSTASSLLYSLSAPNSTFAELKLEEDGEFQVDNEYLRATFKSGAITKLALVGNDSIDFRFELKKYEDRGGAYVFVPGAQTSLPNLKSFFYVSGPLCSRVFGASDSVSISHAISVYKSQDALLDCALHVEVLSDVRTTADETFMFVAGSSGIQNNGTLYTDANGLHMMKRSFNKEEAVAMNFFPLPSAAFLENEQFRLSLLTAQPTAVAPLAPGHFEFMVDRQLQNDDGKGLSPGDADTSLPSRLNYRILLEPRQTGALGKSLFHSSLSFHSLQDLLYPATVVTRPLTATTPPVSWPHVVGGLLPCDVELVSFRFLSDKTALALLRRLPFDGDVSSPVPSDCSGSVDSYWHLLNAFAPDGVFYLSNLTGTQRNERVDQRAFASLFDDAFLIRAIRIELP